MYIAGIGPLGAIATLVLLPPIVKRVFGEEFAISRNVAAPLALVILIMGVEYSAASLLLVLNRYGTRVVGGLIGVASALTFAVLTLGHASLVLAGFLALVGAGSRCAFSVAQLIRNRRTRRLPQSVRTH
jgi:O-antigen/teichoic acid export membrane protein